MRNKEILEEVTEKESEVQGWGKHDGSSEQYAIKESFINGYKLAKERSYSEEDLYSFMDSYQNWLTFTNAKVLTFKEWFEKFKKRGTN